MRTRELTPEQALEGLADFDKWSATEAQTVETTRADIAMAQTFLRRLDLPLRTGDAINLAIAMRVGAALAAFDVKMATSGRTLGVTVCDARAGLEFRGPRSNLFRVGAHAVAPRSRICDIGFSLQAQSRR